MGTEGQGVGEEVGRDLGDLVITYEDFLGSAFSHPLRMTYADEC